LAATQAEREHLVVVAAAHLAVAGASVGPLDADVARFPDSAPRSFVLGRSALNARDPAGAERLLADAWDRATSEDADADARRLAGPIADLLAILGINRRRGDEIVTWARRALATGSQSGVSATLLCHGLAVDGQLAEATDEMTAILAGDPPPVLGLDARLGRGIVRVWANDLDGADQDLAAVEAGIGAVGSFLAQVDVRSYRAEVAYRAGRWPEALDLAEATASIVDDAGEPMFVALPHGVAAFVLAGMGRLAEAQRHADAAATSAEVTGLLPAQLWAAHAELRLAAARGDHAAVASVGDRLVAHGFEHFPEGIHHWRAAYVDALVALGRLADAAGISDELTGLASRHGDVSVAADAARAEGVVAAAQSRGDAARRAFEAGLALDPGTTRPFARARLELAAGAHLRRSGNRRAAAALLGQAAARFDALGAEPWASWCAQETEACGLRPRRRTAPLAGDSALTAQERLVARLAASGRTNREVAAELVISAKTVEHHLGRVYAKLGLRSRTELAARLAAGAGRQDVRSPT
jgi:DNA-binding CsgD family transcriptional regulator